MNLPNRKVEFKPATQGKVPLIIGITGPSGSGKTYSALRLASGIQSVVGGDIFVIDTEAERARHYAKYFKFQHYNFTPPYGPLDYLVAIEAAVKAGAKIVVIDSMTHEHAGEGGVLDQIEKYLDSKGSDYNTRQQYNMLAQVKPKTERKVLNRRIVALGQIVFILLYRAVDKIKPPKKGAKDAEGRPDKAMINMGWQPETTSPLVYDMTARFLLTPGCEGKPNFNPETEAEKMMTKTARQFNGWFNPGTQLTEELGAKMARWAQEGEGTSVETARAALPPAQPPAPAPQAPPSAAPPAMAQPAPTVPLSELALKMCSTFQAARTEAKINLIMEHFNERKGELTIEERKVVLKEKDMALEEILKQGRLA